MTRCKHLPRTAAPALLVLLALTAAPWSHAVDLPPRKPGLWEIRSEQMTVQQCIDPAVDKVMREMEESGSSPGGCSRRMRREGSTLISDSVCKTGGRTITAHNVMTGDFTSDFRVESRITHDPPIGGLKDIRGVTEMRWVGPCKPGQQPGDIVMPNGMTRNVLGSGPRK